MNITKAIIPAAGLGTRFLPFTKAIPKEMLPLIEKPAIQFIVEEAINSGINNFTIVTSAAKHAVENHFDTNPGLEALLREKNAYQLLESTEKMFQAVNFTYVRQPDPLGLGHAVWMARSTVGKEYFGVLLPDEIFIAKEPCLAQLIKIAQQERASVVAVQEVPHECVSSYGVITIKKQITPKLFQVANLIEKPSQKDAPSNLALTGRYVLSHKIFNSLEQMAPYATNELQLTDGISHMLGNGEKVFAYKVQGIRYDIGKPLGWIKAVLGTALQDPRYAHYIREFLADLDTPESFLFNNHKNLSDQTSEK
jgi:UTP--glucose-1-phosphate uridylyltransferase